MKLPAGPVFTTVSRFASEKCWPDGAWSMVVEFLEPPNSERRHRVRVRFLVDAAPDLLRPGERFELYDGWKKIAEGQVENGIE